MVQLLTSGTLFLDGQLFAVFLHGEEQWAEK